MLCGTCGHPIPAGPTPVCPECSFQKALGLGAASAGAGTQIEGYELLHELGSGGMGTVWLAREVSLDRLVALKLIAIGDARLRLRLLREGRAAAQLRHPNIVAVYAMGESGASTFLAMEYVEGDDLGARLRAALPTPTVAAELVAKLASAVAHAHAAGVLHRDIKPSNVIMDLAGQPKLGDFGLAGPALGAGDLTVPGAVAGTPAYLAPELTRGGNALHSVDIYGLGAVLYSCLTGRAPFGGASAAEILLRVATQEPLRPRDLTPAVPVDLETICLKCLEKAPARRYASAQALQADLEAFLRGDPIAARPVGRIERFYKRCRRRPGLTLALAAVLALLLSLAIGGPLAAHRLAASEAAARAAERRAQADEATLRERLRDSLLSRSRLARLSGGRGQRDEALEAATEAARIRPGLDARNEVIAALGRPEAVRLRTFPRGSLLRAVVAVDFPGGRYALEEQPGQFVLRSLDDGRLLARLSGPATKAWSRPVFSRDGRWLSVRNAEAQEVVWDTAVAAPALVLAGLPYTVGSFYLAYGQPDDFAPGGDRFAAALPTGGVAIRALPDGHEVARIGLGFVATHVCYSPDARWLAVGRGLHGPHGETAVLDVLDAATLAVAARLPIENSFQTVRWGPESDRLMTGGEEERIYRIPDAQTLSRVSDPIAIKAFFGPAANTILTTSDSGVATLWDLGTGRPLLAGEVGPTNSADVSADGSLVFLFSEDEAPGLLRIEMPRVVHVQPTRSTVVRDSVSSVAASVVDASPDGRWIATALWGAVQLRDCNGSVVAQFRTSPSDRWSVKFARDGRSLLAAGSATGLVRIPVGPGGRLGAPISIDTQPEFQIDDVSRDGSRALLTNYANGLCRVVDLAGSPPVQWSLPGAGGAAFVGSGDQVVANSLRTDNAGMLEVRDARTGAVVRALGLPAGAHAHASRDGTWVLLGSDEDHTRLLRSADWSAGPPLPPEVQGRGIQAAFSPDGRLIAFGAGQSLALVRTDNGELLARMVSAQGGGYIPGLCFSADGTRVLLWWDNGQLAIWNLTEVRRELAARGLDW